MDIATALLEATPQTVILGGSLFSKADPDSRLSWKVLTVRTTSQGKLLIEVEGYCYDLCFSRLTILACPKSKKIEVVK